MDIARSWAQGETCLFKRKSSKAKRKSVEVPSQRSNAEVFVNKTLHEDKNENTYQLDKRDDNPKLEGSMCTLYVGPNRVPLRIKCEFVEYI